MAKVCRCDKAPFCLILDRVFLCQTVSFCVFYVEMQPYQGKDKTGMKDATFGQIETALPKCPSELIYEAEQNPD